jgi:hypothetical protein
MPSAISLARQFDYGKRFPDVSELILLADSAYDRCEAERSRIVNDRTRTEEFKVEAVKALANKSAKALGPLQRSITKMWEAHDAKKAAVAPVLPPVSEAMALAIGAALARMQPGEQATYLNQPDIDRRVLSAAFQLPHIVSNVNPQVIGAVRQRMIETECQDQLAEIDDELKAIELAQNVVQGATDQAITLAGFGSSPLQAEKWMTEQLAA